MKIESLKLVERLFIIAQCKRQAFTLAEVLITLGIIGIVAAVTMPTVITNYKKKQVVTQLKKSYSLISQAVKLSETQNGETKFWNLNAPSEEFMNTYITPYLKNNEKLSTVVLNSKIQYKTLSGETIKTGTGTIQGYTIKLADGSFLIVDEWYPENNSFRTIYVDINGYKKPNTLGKDLFGFFITNESRVNPYGQYKEPLQLDEIIKSSSGQGCDTNGAGLLCSALIMHDNWEITDRYPW